MALTNSNVVNGRIRIALIGQSQFAVEVYRLLSQKHDIVGVFTVPDVNGRPDPLAQAAAADSVSVFKFARWRRQGVVLDEVLSQYKSVGAELNVLPYCTQFIPMEVITEPRHQSICYHPSLLPLHRGASSINWTLIHGDKKTGFTIFWADDGLDTGPILLQKSCVVEPDDTVETLYNRFLYPEGIKALGEAVQLLVDGKAPAIWQPAEGATYEPMMKKELAQIRWDMSAMELHNFIRGNDKVPGAWAVIDNQKMTLFGSRLWTKQAPRAKAELTVDGCPRKAVIHSRGILFTDDHGNMVNVDKVQLEDGKTIPASQYGQNVELVAVGELNTTEQEMIEKVKEIWSRILNSDQVNDKTDFFKSGAGSMDVVRLVEEIRSECGGLKIEPDSVYMSAVFSEFVQTLVLVSRGVSLKPPFTYHAVEKVLKGTKVTFPHQLFINNEFIDASDGGTFDTICPYDEQVICQVAKGTKDDVDVAVEAAHEAFYEGEWSRMSARDRGNLMYRLADLMEAHKEELSMIESLDSGAVYTLALKTHVGMSIDVFRYFAGWCDKIQGKTIPISHARPSKNLTFTKREPIGVCAIITPWNYPLMMLAWKMSACLAAGNTVVLKPAMVTPLTSLKFAELVVRAGFPPGVVNILPGSGSVIGEALSSHPLVRKVGFTGSTPVGKSIMQSAAKSNAKKVSLELGGKSPLIIFADCDVDRAVRFACNGVFFNKGENCIAAGRLFVEDSLHDQFISLVVEEVQKMKIGDPLDTDTHHGPQNHRAHLDSLLDYCKTGVNEGATLVYGGKRVDRPGLFMYPTIFTDVTDDMFIASEESFGPVMIVSRFADGDINGVLRSANATEYGLAAGVFTRDIGKALHVSDRLLAGTVFVNTYNKTDVAAPFGGYKQSGFGKDLGEEALNEYLQTKAVTIEY